MKTLINSNLHFSNLFRELVAAYKKPPVTFEVVAEAFCGPENSSEFRKPPMTCKSLRIFPASNAASNCVLYFIKYEMSRYNPYVLCN